MSLELKIAKRYLISKKSTNAINVISLITAVAIGLGTMAIILVLSVFNGFEGLVTNLYKTFNAEIEITAAKGKTFSISEQDLKSIESIKGVEIIAEIIEENAMISYNQKQHIATLKGVDSSYFIVHPTFKDKVFEGHSVVQADGNKFALIGAGISQYLGIDVDNYYQKLHIHIPKKNSSISSIESATNRASISPIGIFAIQQDFNNKYILVPKAFLENLLSIKNETSMIEIKTTNGSNVASVIKDLKSILGEQYEIKDRLQQNEALYRVMKTEKWIVFIILSFIIVIASFNIIGSLSMLIIEKRPDIATLLTLGTTRSSITKIFLAESMLLSGIGAFTGMAIAFILCLLQQHLGIIKIPGNSFLMQYYPVKMQLADFLVVAFVVIIISLVTSYMPARRAAKNIDLIDQIRKV